MNKQLRTWFKDRLLAFVDRVIGRHVVLLPAEAASDERLLSLQAPYRVEESSLPVVLNEPGPGHLVVTLLAYEGHFPTATVWISPTYSYHGPCTLRMDLQSGAVTIADQEWGRLPLPLPTRRFCLRFSFIAPDGRRRERLTGHYLPGTCQIVDERYFRGDDYVDYDAQSVSTHTEVVRLVHQYAAQAPVLEVGCATGGLLAALDRVGLAAVGVDSSRWAIEQVAQRVGAERAWLCDVERDPFPDDVLQRHPFRTLVLWSVFEHFADPFAVLTKVSGLCAAGAILLLDTTNARSLTRTVLASQWEGYFDWTHAGIDRVSVHSLREMLPRLGWRIENLVTRHIWDGSADPLHATWREWWAIDARFRRFVVEQDLGDFITCVAVKL